MTKTQAFCGLDCGECEARTATLKNDQAGLEQAARNWTAQYGKDITAEMCICEGCASGGRVSSAHAATCAIRLCASARQVPTCAHCPEYGCDTNKAFFSFAPVLKEKLEAIRTELGK